MDSKDRQIEELKTLVAALTKRVAELELALAKATKDSSTSSKPPQCVRCNKSLWNRKFDWKIMDRRMTATRIDANEWNNWRSEIFLSLIFCQNGENEIDVVAVKFLPASEFPDRDRFNIPSAILFEQTDPGNFTTHILETGACDQRRGVIVKGREV